MKGSRKLAERVLDALVVFCICARFFFFFGKKSIKSEFTYASWDLNSVHGVCINLFVSLNSR